ncbi:MAG TPA: hypothetical protein VLC55_11285 [Burkholderiales bacterium]|nr:hypothetical protein [Burkholderiales bacterium]
MSHRRQIAAIQGRRVKPELLRPVAHTHDGQVEIRIHVHLFRLGELVAVESHFDARGRARRHMGVGHDPAAPGIHQEAGAAARALLVVLEGHRHRGLDLHRVAKGALEDVLAVVGENRVGESRGGKGEQSGDHE